MNNKLKKAMLPVAAAFLGAALAASISRGNETSDARYKRLTSEAMTVFKKQGYTATSTEPSRWAQATYGANAAFCYTLKKNPDDGKAYEGCVDMGKHAELMSIRPR